jgi:Na+/glutamate symporter
MSSGGFHVHGPHDHELEHARSGHADHDAHGDEAAKRMTNQIALFTAVIATVGALFAYMGGATQANAGIYKNNAAIKKTEASNQWNYFQAKSTKQSLAEGFEQTSRDWDKKSDEQIHLHHRWAQATTVLQVSIALAAIALLTRRKWLEWGMFGTGALGVAIGVAAMLHI